MIIVECAVEGCSSVYTSDERASVSGVRYICSHHTDRELRAAGLLKTERSDKDVHFQNHQFDKGIKRPLNRKYWAPTPDSPELPKSALGGFLEEAKSPEYVAKTKEIFTDPEKEEE
jgi:hypothetical protein